jgi:hypothetical protein
MTQKGQKGQFAPPRLSGRSTFSEETFAGRCGNEKDAPAPVIPVKAIKPSGYSNPDIQCGPIVLVFYV